MLTSMERLLKINLDGQYLYHQMVREWLLEHLLMMEMGAKLDRSESFKKVKVFGFKLVQTSMERLVFIILESQYLYHQMVRG